MGIFWLVLPWLRRVVLVAALALPALGLLSQAGAQPSDPNAPYKDAYDVQTRGLLVGSWQGTIGGSKLSQADGQLGGQAVFVRRGYQGRDSFGIVLHDHRHRNGLEYSDISIGDIPCGPDGGTLQAITKLEPTPLGANVIFHNRVADTRSSDFRVDGRYGVEPENPATLRSVWNDDGLSLRLSGPFIAAVVPIRNGAFDYERQNEGWLDRIHLDVEFTLERDSEFFELTLCEEPEVFHVVESRPESGRENVLLDGADFFIEFSDELAAGSVDSTTVFMTTRDADNGLVFVDLDLSLEDESGAEDKARIRIEPREPLLPGTVYEISVTGGEEGVRGYERQVLEQDFTFSVSTVIDPEDLRLEIHQVSKNAPLIKGKPAAARVFVEWYEREDVNPAWQVLRYSLEAEIRDYRDRTIFPEMSETIKRTDVLTEEDYRLGRHAVNLFGWTPSSGSLPTTFIAHIKPQDPWPEDVEPEPLQVSLGMQYPLNQSDLLLFDYYVAEHAEWSEEGADADTIMAVQAAARREQAFLNQILPVPRVVGRYQGSYNIARLACEIPGLSHLVCDENKGDLMALFSLFYEHISARSIADVIVSYHPPSLGGTGRAYVPFDQAPSLIARPGETRGSSAADPALQALHRSDRVNRNMIVMSTSPLRGHTAPAIVDVPLVAHEFGHVFALPHTPYADDGAHRAEICEAYGRSAAEDIDGMRIALDGATGWQKSSEFGNAQSRSPIRNLMFPCATLPRDLYWIDPDQYAWLVDRMPALLRNARRQRAGLSVEPAVRQAQSDERWGGLLRRASFQGQDGSAPGHRWLMLSGLVQGGEAALLPAIPVPGPREALSGEGGAYELRVEDTSGRVLARAPVGPTGPEGDAWPFSVTVPLSGKPSRIVLLHDGAVLAETRANPALTAPEVRSHRPGGVYRAGEALLWESEPAEGLTYSVRFTGNGKDWSTLAVLLGQPRFTPDPATLAPGPGSAFEIVAQDGVSERKTRLPVQVEVPLQPLASWPEAGAVLEAGAAAGLAFNVPIDAETLDAIELRADGVLVPARVSLDPSGMLVSIAPQAPEAGVTYTALADSGLRARDGRPLDAGIEIRFTVAPLPSDNLEPAPEAAEPPETASGPETVGPGEITLNLGEPTTLRADILGCTSDEKGDLARLETRFQTNPGDHVQIAMQRVSEEALSVEMFFGQDRVFSGQGGAEDGWHLGLSGGQVAAKGKVGAGEETGFTLTGRCPS
ncbi:Ig-like domain-containing protein [Aquibaculum arenosum]|uniref:Ig-like domain-containing protein n=1 Tax=Aquibaculum arenosum TaxID=3032591 RepID=A0ABT5YHD2_9PROT|nr:Ig-like domain-containing protein [Fodinicurvata sp. CAU 1616]MDF2094354.1 Ig-like domain-containing protein [Fodinicurvata sp. CAU 1616]